MASSSSAISTSIYHDARGKRKLSDEAEECSHLTVLGNRSASGLKLTVKAKEQSARHQNSTFNRLSRSITGSLRVKKKRSFALQSADPLFTPSLHRGGYFDVVNKTVSCTGHSDTFTSCSSQNGVLFCKRSLKKTQKENADSSAMQDLDASLPAHANSSRFTQGWVAHKCEPGVSKGRNVLSSAMRPEPEGAEAAKAGESAAVSLQSVGERRILSQVVFNHQLYGTRASDHSFLPDVSYGTAVHSSSYLFSECQVSGADYSCREYLAREPVESAKGCDFSKKPSSEVPSYVRLNRSMEPSGSCKRIRNYFRERRCRKEALNKTYSLSLAVGEDQSAADHKLIAACSVTNVSHTGDQNDKIGRVSSWAVNFDKLLKDPVGVVIFTEFLKKEFSEENIIFWKACEQYRQLADDQQRKAQARDIYTRYLSARASDPVNVDSATRSYTEKFLDNPTAVMFDVAQQQIFQLMRQDSYARFLKSDLYKSRLMAEMEGRPLVFPAELEQKVEDKTDKKKGKGKENEDKRRKSILPWKQSRKSVKSTSESELKKAGKKGKGNKEKETVNANNQQLSEWDSSTTIDTTSNNTSTVRKVPGPGIDLSTMRKEVFNPKESKDATESHFKFCRIVMPDGSTTVVCAKPGQASRAVLSKLCEKRSISIASVDVFLLGSDRPLDLDEDISTLGSKEIVIEKRVLFRMDLPNGKSVGVKAKPNRSIRDVFKPILNKYGYHMENITVHLVGSQECIDLDVAVSELNNQRAVIVTDADMTEVAKKGMQVMPSKPPKAPPVNQSKGGPSGSRGGSLEEITNKIFEDLMRGKSQLAHGFDELGVLELDKAKAHKGEEAHYLGLFGLLRKESWGVKDNNKISKMKGRVTFALPKIDSKKKSIVKEGERLFEMLSSAQKLRLEEQRGVLISTGDLPSFLCLEKEEGKQEGKTVVEEVHLDTKTTVSSVGNMFDDIDEISKAGFLEKRFKKKGTMNYPATPHLCVATPQDTLKANTFTTPASEKWKSDLSFRHDGIIPSPGVAEAYFGMSPLIIDSKNIFTAQESLFQTHHTQPVAHSFVDSLFREANTAWDELDATSYVGNNVFSTDKDCKAQLASPEKFSPESKKLHRNSEVSSTLINKVSLAEISSSASLNLPSLFRESQISQPASDYLQLHSKRDGDSFLSYGDDINTQANSSYYNTHASAVPAAVTANQSNNSISPNQVKLVVLMQQDLAQNVLPSPNFDQAFHGKVFPLDSNTSPSFDIAQRAFLSPRCGTSLSQRPVDPPPYHRKASPFVHAKSDIVYEGREPSRYPGHLGVKQSLVLSQARRISHESPILSTSPGHEFNQVLGSDQIQCQSYLSTLHNMPAGYAQKDQNKDVEQETVTFV